MASSGNKQTLSANGQSAWTRWQGPISISLKGNFGGGSAQLQVRVPDDIAENVANAAFTVAADHLLDYPEQAVNEVRVDLSGATGPSLRIWVQGDDRP